MDQREIKKCQCGRPLRGYEIHCSRACRWRADHPAPTVAVLPVVPALVARAARGNEDASQAGWAAALEAQAKGRPVEPAITKAAAAAREFERGPRGNVSLDAVGGVPIRAREVMRLGDKSGPAWNPMPWGGGAVDLADWRRNPEELLLAKEARYRELLDAEARVFPVSPATPRPSPLDVLPAPIRAAAVAVASGGKSERALAREMGTSRRQVRRILEQVASDVRAANSDGDRASAGPRRGIGKEATGE